MHPIQGVQTVIWEKIKIKKLLLEARKGKLHKNGVSFVTQDHAQLGGDICFTPTCNYKPHLCAVLWVLKQRCRAHKQGKKHFERQTNQQGGRYTACVRSLTLFSVLTSEKVQI